MKRNQKGFGAVEELLVTVVVLLIGFIGWYVYHTSNGANSTYNQVVSTSAAKTGSAPAVGTKIFTNSSKLYTFNYPERWTAEEVTYGADFTPAPVLDNAEVQVHLLNAPSLSSNTPTPDNIVVSGFKSNDAQAILDGFIGVKSDGSSYVPQKLAVNGNSTLYQRVVKPEYTDDIYVMSHTGTTLLFSFREKQAAGPSGVTSVNASGFVPDYTTLVRSTRFLN